MPANLSPQYLGVEKKYKEAGSTEEKIEVIEELLSIIPKHKGTEKLQAMWKTKMAKLKNAAQKKGGAVRFAGHKVRKSGAGQVVVIGPPNVGKSLLVQSLTGTQLKVDPNAYSTHEASPVMMPFEDIKIQLVDTPPISPEYMEEWYPDLLKTADGAIILLDLADDRCLDLHEAVMEKLEAKKITFFDYHTGPPSEQDRRRCYLKTILVGTKSDLLHDEELLQLYKEELEPRFQLLPVSPEMGTGIEQIRKEIYIMLDIIRVYSKSPGKKAERVEPFTLPVGSTVMELAETVHKDFAENLKFARIWGKSLYDGQRVNHSHILKDEDLIELHM